MNPLLTTIKNPMVNRVKVEEKEMTIMVAKEVNLFSSLIKMAEGSERS